MSHRLNRIAKLIVTSTVGIPLLASSAFAAPKQVSFKLSPNQPFLQCMAASSSVTPKVNVLVERGPDNDKLTLTLWNFKPGLAFDMFTVEKTSLKPNGKADPNFKNFGLAWYQSDIHIASTNPTKVIVKTILLDQIFGFDPIVNLAPTNTFNVGFWFNNPADAAPCGFDVAKPTPFNGEHKAGPVAFISVPNSTTKLGPLCTKPNTSTVPATCDP